MNFYGDRQKKFDPSAITVPYALAVTGQEEIDRVCKAMREERLSAGPDVQEFEQKISSLFGKKHGVMTNSGSSANLLALELSNMSDNSEVITPALTFSTVVSPLLQKRLKPVFVDVNPRRYVVDVQAIKDAITSQTRAIMIPSLIGNVPDMRGLQQICEEQDILFIEDSCDTLGATFNGLPTGYYSDISTTSFYGSHIITAGGMGGMLCVNKDDWFRRAKMLRGWGRSSAVFETEDLSVRFAAQIDGLDYDAKFIFDEVGYNFHASELCAAFGLAQLEKLPRWSLARKSNFARLSKFFAQFEDDFILPEQTPNSETNWLAFPLTIKSDRFTRREITTCLENAGIQTRPLFAGNILRQPGFKDRLNGGSFPIADCIMERGFLIGCHQSLSDIQLSYMEQAFTNFLTK